MTYTRATTSVGERGAAMVEFALILPLLLLLVFGIVEFGRAYNVKVQLTGSVREGARVLALGGSATEAQDAVIAAAPGLNPALGTGSFATTSCPAGGAEGDATVSVAYSLPSLTPVGAVIARFYPTVSGYPAGDIPLSATGVMRCGL